LKNLKPVFGWAVFLFFCFSAFSPAVAAEKQVASVEEVLTGDSVRLQGGKIFKYAGLVAPPLQHIIPLTRVYGQEALEFNKSLVLGKKIWIQWGPQLRDDRGNFLGYAFLENGTLINKEILRAGHAKAYIRPPNLQYAAEFRQAELEAHRQALGLWKQEPKNPYLQSTYLGEKNTKLYYLSNSPELERIPQANLVTFHSRVDATAAGYKPCPACHEYSASSESEQLY